MFRMFWQIEKFDHKMGLLESKANVSRSLVRAFLSMMYARMSAASPGHQDNEIFGGNAVTLTGGYVDSSFFMCQEFGDSFIHAHNGAAYLYTGAHCGILIGNGTTGVTFTDFSLPGQYAHGTGTDEFIYMGGSVHNPVVSAPYTYFDFDRIFENRSGGSITVKELGIATFYDTRIYLICRDVLSAIDYVTVADGEYLKVTYRMRVST